MLRVGENGFEVFGDWGLGIGDWANPQSPIPNPLTLKNYLYF